MLNLSHYLDYFPGSRIDQNGRVRSEVDMCSLIAAWLE